MAKTCRVVLTLRACCAAQHIHSEIENKSNENDQSNGTTKKKPHQNRMQYTCEKQIQKRIFFFTYTVTQSTNKTNERKKKKTSKVQQLNIQTNQIERPNEMQNVKWHQTIEEARTKSKKIAHN